MVKSKINNLEELLAKSFGNDVDVVNQETTLLTAPGEHYGSVMLAIDITLQNRHSKKSETYNLVAKLPPANQMLKVAFDIPVTFKKEVFAYMETIPALIQLQKDRGVPEEKLLDIFPKCHGARISLDLEKNEVDDDGVLIFENLKKMGYKTEDRLVGFDLEAAKLVIKDLAKFHAVPLGLKILHPELFKEKVLPALAKNKGLEQLPEEVGLAFHNSITEGAYEVEELRPFLGRIQNVVDHAAKNPYVNRPSPNELFGTMTHSDFWTSNTMLLRSANGKPLKNKIVDLQMMTYTSAVRDLIFFLFTSVISSVLNDHFDDLVKLYYDSFIEVLEELKIDISKFTWKAFKEELEEVGPTEVYHILVMLKPICTEKGKVQNSLEDFQNSDWSRKDLLGPSHRRKLKDTVLELVKLNWI